MPVGFSAASVTLLIYFTECGCGAFDSNFLCAACDKHWEQHETVFESEADRIDKGLPVGKLTLWIEKACNSVVKLFAAVLVGFFTAEKMPENQTHNGKEQYVLNKWRKLKKKIKLKNLPRFKI